MRRRLLLDTLLGAFALPRARLGRCPGSRHRGRGGVADALASLRVVPRPSEESPSPPPRGHAGLATAVTRHAEPSFALGLGDTAVEVRVRRGRGRGAPGGARPGRDPSARCRAHNLSSSPDGNGAHGAQSSSPAPAQGDTCGSCGDRVTTSRTWTESEAAREGRAWPGVGAAASGRGGRGGCTGRPVGLLGPLLGWGGR